MAAALREGIILASITPICLCCFGRGGSNMAWNLIGSSADVLMTHQEWHKIAFNGKNEEKLRRVLVGLSRRGVKIAPGLLQSALAPAYRDGLRKRTEAAIPLNEREQKPEAKYVVLKVMDYHLDLLPAIKSVFGEARIVVLSRGPEAQVESLLRSKLTLSQACRWYRNVTYRMD
ncbi:hypothetical protein LCGC14_2588800, partial [marine sediment metagenome]